MCTNTNSTFKVGSSTVGDCFEPAVRGQAIATINLGAVLGSCLGPVAGGFAVDYLNWRWTFYITSIITAAYLLISFFTSTETYPPVLLLNKKKKMLKSGNVPNYIRLRTIFEDKKMSVTAVYLHSLSRPFRLLFTQPIVQALALYYGFLYGLIYLLLSSFSDLWTKQYGMRISTGSLNYIGPCIGYSLGSILCAICTNRAYAALKARNNGKGQPELRLPMMVPASLLVPIGMFWYGWSAKYKLHWIMPDIGIALPLFGATIIFQCSGAYLLDTFTIYAASANGAIFAVRAVIGCLLPLFSPVMYSKLGYGWGNSVLGFIAIGIGLPTPLLLLWYGQRLREASKFTHHSMQIAR